MNYSKEIDDWILSNKEEILSTLSELVQIKTINTPPGGNEKPGQQFLANYCSRFIEDKDIDLFEIDDVPGIREHKLFFPTIDGIVREYKNRPNLVAKIPGTGFGKSLVFSGHIDTMPVREKEWNIFKDPFSGRIKDGRMYGRGVSDMKAGTLSGFIALKCIKDLKIRLKGDLYAESVIDEENGGVNGTIAARLRYPDIDFAILSECSGLEIGVSTRGGVDMKVSVEEEGSGGISFSEIPPNPIFKLSEIALALKKFDDYRNKRLRELDKNAEYLPLFVYQFYSGGTDYRESGAVPIEGHIYFWIESLTNMDPDQVRNDFNSFMRKALLKKEIFKNKLPDFIEVIRFLEGHKTDLSHPALNSIKKAYQRAGLAYRETNLKYASDAFAFKLCSPTDVAIIGPSGGNHHGIDEFVDIESVFSLIKIMVHTAIEYCS
ncbi:M20/M25/M40 family metallo-hydrolase [bacterium]|nr:M20/M25/M40 family metallo-hydrolase [bacterium]